MYQALYRKWRPRSFDEVVGQDAIVTTLKNEIRAGRPSHAYLLVGSRGTGKTTCAKLIAKAVNCPDMKDGNPCGECPFCRDIDRGMLTDVEEIDAASNNGVDQIRDLRERALFLPGSARFRVYIIDEAHMLSTGAVNALLKIMEEPPAHVIFILATTEVHKIPATIRSRCQRFDFRRIDSAAIQRRLLLIAEREGIRLADDAALLMARAADGGMRDALSLLDMAWARGGDISLQTAGEVIGAVGQEALFRISDAIGRKDVSSALAAMEEAGGRTIEYERLCGQLITHYRNLLVAAVTEKPDDLIVCLPETLKQYRERAAGMRTPFLMDAIRTLQTAQTGMAKTASRRAELELAIIRLCDARMRRSQEALAARVEELEARLNRLLAEGDPEPDAARRDAPEPHAETRSPALSPEDPRRPPVPTEPPAAGEKPQAPQPMPEELWDHVLERLAGSDKMLYHALIGSRAYVREQTALIECDNPVFLEMMRTNKFTRAALKRVIAEVTGVRYGVGPYAPPAETDALTPMQQLLRNAKEQGIPVEEL